MGLPSTGSVRDPAEEWTLLEVGVQIAPPKSWLPTDEPDTQTVVRERDRPEPAVLDDDDPDVVVRCKLLACCIAEAIESREDRGSAKAVEPPGRVELTSKQPVLA